MGLTVTSHTEGLPGPQELRLLLCNLSKQAAEQSICRREFKPQLNREGQAALSMAWNPPPPRPPDYKTEDGELLGRWHATE